MGKVLIVDDEQSLRSIVKGILKDEGFIVMEAIDGVDALEKFRSDIPDAVLLDIKMPRRNGLDTLEELLRIDREVPVIILTAHADVPVAVQATKTGAYDFLVKPPDFDKLVITLNRAVEKRKLSLDFQKARFALRSSLSDIFGKSPAIKSVIGQIEQIAPTDVSVIIHGETGTGKSVVANAIHSMSKRSNMPFVSVDIGLVPEHLVESELFGYKKGAFTGAEKDKAGYFEASNGGSIFIDEMENISVQMQGKLLSFIENKKIFPLGSNSPVNVDVRILAATNKDIRQSVKKKEFREDLFYRLAEFIIYLPPLRERADDVPFFAKKFLYQIAGDLKKHINGIEDNAISSLKRYAWPGNLRELKNVVRRAILLSDSDVITKECIDCLISDEYSKSCASALSPSLKDSLKDMEKNMIIEALEKTGGNKTRAAELLDVSYQHLFNKIKEYGIRCEHP